MAARVEIGDDQEAGVARSSRAGTKRNVKAGPTIRACPGRSGWVPAQPDVAQALLQQHRRDRCGGNGGQDRGGFGGQRHGGLRGGGRDEVPRGDLALA